MEIGHHEYFLRSSETLYEVLDIARVNSYSGMKIIYSFMYRRRLWLSMSMPKFRTSAAKYVEADSNKKSCSSLKTTTA
jgi:hypothetical protein